MNERSRARTTAALAAAYLELVAAIEDRDRRIAELEASLHDNHLIADGAYDRAELAVAENKRLAARIAELEQLLADAASQKMAALQAKIDADLDEAMRSDKWISMRRVP